MGWITNLLGGNAGNIISEVGNVADKFHLSGEEKQQFQIEVEALLQKRDSELEQTLRKELEAKERVLVAELNQGDNYTKRARPTVVYFGLGLIFLNYCLIPGIQFLRGNATATCTVNEGVQNCAINSGIQLPAEFWWAWGGIVGTWSIGRSLEKAGANNRAVRAITGNGSKPRELPVG
ncbi:MAG TPA: 3TM-type holin [Dongiaceae bacterium]|nr:3TM-type holin [Dongiaceae bacterium]